MELELKESPRRSAAAAAVRQRVRHGAPFRDHARPLTTTTRTPRRPAQMAVNRSPVRECARPSTTTRAAMVCGSSDSRNRQATARYGAGASAAPTRIGRLERSGSARSTESAMKTGTCRTAAVTANTAPKANETSTMLCTAWLIRPVINWRGQRPTPPTRNRRPRPTPARLEPL